MKVYLHDIELNFQKITESQIQDFDCVIEPGNEQAFKSAKENVFYNSADFEDVVKMLEVLQDKNPKGINSITIPIENKEKVKEFLKERYTFIKAAGGLVKKDDRYLMIYRLKKWDLPKGKLEKDEEILACAIREVEEECCIKVEAKAKIGSTWHCYPTKAGWCVKKSTWYLMDCLDDSKMAPQIEESIEDIAWVGQETIGKYLANSYGTIKDVFLKAKKKGLL